MLVPQKLLDNTDITAVIEHVRCAGMAEQMRSDTDIVFKRMGYTGIGEPSAGIKRHRQRTVANSSP